MLFLVIQQTVVPLKVKNELRNNDFSYRNYEKWGFSDFKWKLLRTLILVAVFSVEY